MALKTFKPDTPGKRNFIQVDRSALWKGKPEKSLTVGLSKTGGRNNFGRVTSWHKGGGHKRSYRIIDFKRLNRDLEFTVERIEYDPNRTAFIALISSGDTKTYIIAPSGLKAGDKVYAGESADIKVGNALPLKSIPIGTVVHNVELKPGKGGQMARSAGASVSVAGKDSGKVLVKLRSGEVRLVDDECYATIGVVSNSDHQNTKVGKAGRSRWKGIRPVVRGVAMNPIDHPHGGGEGRTSGGRHPVSPWGKCAKGKKTRNNKRTDKFIVRRRSK